VVLQAHLTPNPLSCVTCNLEVPPERLGFSGELAEQLAYWRDFHDAFYFLWLDSAEFESWAESQLSDPQSPVNRRGIALAAQVNAHRRCYFWWFQEGLTSCPCCNGPLLATSSKFGWQVCEPCSVLLAHERRAA
jgi:hypothetical protein